VPLTKRGIQKFIQKRLIQEFPDSDPEPVLLRLTLFLFHFAFICLGDLTMSGILLIAPSSSSTTVAEALRLELRTDVEVVPARRAGVASLRRSEFALVLIDEALAATGPDDELLYQIAAGALVLELNFALCSAARIVRHARAALSRRAQDRASARAAATSLLHNELNATLAGLLLESQLALRAASPAQAPKLQYVVQLAGDLRERLRA
jgi:hypothetical protein